MVQAGSLCEPRDPRWISEERAYPGLQLKLIGRNLDAWEYGGSRNTQIRLVPTHGGEAVVITPDSVNPYCVDFSLPSGLAAGNYNLEVNANSAAYGRDWVRLNDHSEYPDGVRDTVLQLEPAPTNATALALKVKWANDFPWNRVVNAKSEFGQKGTARRTTPGRSRMRLDQVSESGGGVVLLPKGSYKVSVSSWAASVFSREKAAKGRSSWSRRPATTGRSCPMGVRRGFPH